MPSWRPLRRIFYDAVEQAVAPTTQRDQVEGTLVAVAFVGIVVNVQARIAFSADLTTVSRPPQRCCPSCLPLGLHPILREGHLPQLRGPGLPGKPRESLRLAMELKAQGGAGVAQQARVPWVSGAGRVTSTGDDPARRMRSGWSASWSDSVTR